MQTNITAKFTDHSKAVTDKTANFVDLFLGLMAVAIEANVKTGGSVPLLNTVAKGGSKNAIRGALRASIRHQKIAPGKYIVTMGTGSPADAYAAAQEAGQTHGHQIKNYSTPGTHAGFMAEAILTVLGNKEEYIDRAKKAVGLGGI
jgi:3-hydroxyisobutyrate dehydrogenase-like beta-hydroxyacid dehydrogenase